MLTRSLRFSKQIMPSAQRMFSSNTLLVPLQTKSHAPSEFDEGFPLTNHLFTVMEKEYEAYNEKCKNDLQSMNENKIDNLISRGGTDGWSTVGELDALTKTFVFDNFEQANAFVQQVGKFAETNDHHPEWTTSNGGTQVHARLTSHFANNKVTIFDFELAENMNKSFASAMKHNLYPSYTNSQLLSATIGLGSIVVLFGTYQVLK